MDNDGTVFCRYLEIDNAMGVLKWDNRAPIEETLIVSVPIGRVDIHDINGFIEKVVSVLEDRHIDISHGEYTNLPGSDVWLKRVTNVEKVSFNGCLAYQPARTYIVLAVENRGDETIIYKPLRDDSTIIVDFPLKVCYEVGTFNNSINVGRRTINEEYFALKFFCDYINSYRDGMLAYVVNGVKISITRQMIERQVVYIRKMNNEILRIQPMTTQVKIENRR